ncbi:MAG: thiamine pyrophosphate-binding protein [Gammaproteobacteria bacterium]|nr:thiamine pyrophosphate-binding protein [Gammaproteobacteria bacterium]
MRALTGGMVVSQALGRYGVRSVFALAGASHTYLLDALQQDGWQIYSHRHESGCVSAADGYARVTGQLGIALIIADQGMPNAINGIATAFQAGSPVLILVARLPNSWTEAESEYDNLKQPLVSSISKWARTVPSANRLAEYVDTAAKRALSGRPGPVVLQIPQEYLGETVAPETSLSARPAPASRPAPDAGAIREAAQRLYRAKTPLLITGAGATQSDAAEIIARLAKDFSLPIAGNSLGRGLVAENFVTSFNWPYMQYVAHQADVVCVLGSRLKQRLGYGLPPRFARDATFIQVDIEAEELSRNRRVEIPIVADVRLACEALYRELEALRAADPTHADSINPARHNWVYQALAPRRQALDALRASVKPAAGTLHPLQLGDRLAAKLPDDAIVVGDGADIQNWMYASLAVKRNPGFMDHYPMGAMGVGTPLSVGAAAAAKEISQTCTKNLRQVVLVTGDGAFGFYPAELHAAALAGLKLIVIIGNDGAWGTELHGQLAILGRSVNTELQHLPYEKVAEGFGCRGEAVTELAQLDSALERAFTADGPYLLNVHIDRHAGALLKTEPLVRMILFDDLEKNL